MRDPARVLGWRANSRRRWWVLPGARDCAQPVSQNKHVPGTKHLVHRRAETARSRRRVNGNASGAQLLPSLTGVSVSITTSCPTAIAAAPKDHGRESPDMHSRVAFHLVGLICLVLIVPAAGAEAD